MAGRAALAWRGAVLAAGLLGAAAAGAQAARAPAAKPAVPPAGSVQLKCNVGPTPVQLSGQAWLAFACSDGKSVAIASQKGNPAHPYLFLVAALKDRYVIRGRGTGNLKVAHAAGRELESWRPEAVAALHARVKARR